MGRRSTVGISASDVASNLIPTADNVDVLGSASNRWASVSAVVLSVYAAAGAAQPSAQISNGTLSLGAGATALDVRLQRTGVGTLTIDNGLGGAATVIGPDNLLTLGTSAARLAAVVSGPGGHKVFGVQSAANPSAVLGDQSLQLGAGATALDVRLLRAAPATLTLDNGTGGNFTLQAAQQLFLNGPTGVNLQFAGANVASASSAGQFDPGADQGSNLGQTSRRWANLSVGNRIHIFSTQGDANSTTEIGQGFVEFGSGTAPQDVLLQRSAAATLQLSNAAAGAITVSCIAASIITNTAGDMTYASAGNVLLSPGAGAFVKFGNAPVAAGAGATALNTTTGGSGPTGATAAGWLKALDNAGVAFFWQIWR